MTRKRQDPSLAWLPPRVYKVRNKYVYQPAIGGKIALCNVDDGKLAVLKRYEQEQIKLGDANLFTRVISDFLLTDSFYDLSRDSQKEYTRYSIILDSVFGKMKPSTILPKHVRAFMVKLAKAKAIKGVPANPTANRAKATMQKICSWALQEGRLSVNPCVGVNKLKETPRDTYITDAQYHAIYQQAPPACRAAMEIAYLCMARIGDVVALTRHQILSEGVLIEQGKTGKKQIKSWSDRLTAAVESANKLPLNKGIPTIFLFHKKDGSRYSIRGIQLQYTTACQAANVKGVTFHDIKARGISDFEGSIEEKRDAAGHTNINQTRTYDRKIPVVKPTR